MLDYVCIINFLLLPIIINSKQRYDAAADNDHSYSNKYATGT